MLPRHPGFAAWSPVPSAEREGGRTGPTDTETQELGRKEQLGRVGGAIRRCPHPQQSKLHRAGSTPALHKSDLGLIPSTFNGPLSKNPVRELEGREMAPPARCTLPMMALGTTGHPTTKRHGTHEGLRAPRVGLSVLRPAWQFP